PQRAPATPVRAVGENALKTAQSNLALGTTLYNLGDLDSATAAYRRALAAREAATGPESNEVATVLVNLATVERDRGNVEEAQRLDERALAIKEKVLGPSHFETIVRRGNHAYILVTCGDLTRSRVFRVA